MTLNAAVSDRYKAFGQQLTIEANFDWKVDVMVELRAWIARRKAQGATHMTFEEFRHEARHQPDTHKAWGALATACKTAGMLEFDGYVKAQSAKTHSHPVARWRFSGA